MHGDEIDVSGAKGYSIPVPSERKARKQVSSLGSAPGRASLHTRLHDLQRLACDLTAPFITLSVERIDTEIRACIRKIVILLDLDRGFLAQYSDRSQSMFPTHLYEIASAKKAGTSRTISVPHWVMEMMLHRECVIFSRAADLPEAASKAGKYFESVGTQSHLSLPLEVDGIVI